MTSYYFTRSSKHFKCFVFLILMFVMALNTSAQTTVTGIISDKNGPTPGANVNLKGSTNGSSSDFDGKYAIKSIPSNGVLSF